MRHRRAAQCRQIDALQRAHADRGGAGGKLPVLHDRAECRRGRRARSAPETLARIAGSKDIIPTRLTLVDIAGLVRGASKGEGLGNQFLANIRECDAIAHVVRCFEDSDVTHVEGAIDPIRDIETIETELMLADLESVEKRLVAIEKKAKFGDKEAKEQFALMSRSLELLREGRPARVADVAPDERRAFGQLGLLSSKPVLY